MKASETNFLKFLQGTKQFIIPIYQRTYSWTIEQCQNFWDDIVRTADQKIKGHFMGSIVYIERGLYQISTVPQLLVIDGQQRMTTLTLFLLALGKVIEKRGKSFITRKKIMNYYLLNSEEESQLYNKLVLTKRDKDTLFRLISDTPLPADYSQKIYENYLFFFREIEESELDLQQLYEGISKLIIVDISLDRDNDNPQLIFESLNSTGLDLSQSDLVRNFVLMQLTQREQETLYNDYWYPMEGEFFDRFIRDYLTVKLKRIPNMQQVYTSFKEYVHHNELSIQEIIADMYDYSNRFMKLVEKTEEDRQLKQVLVDIDSLKVDVSYPFLLEVYADYEKEMISKSDFLIILKWVESYIFRRSVCGLPANSLNKVFATLHKEMDKTHYMEGMREMFLMKRLQTRFPTDSEFVKSFKEKDMYHSKHRHYVLRKLENFNRKELVSIKEYTIEHIMPQNKELSAEWKEDLGEDWKEVHYAYLHTIGNLTLTGYNSKLSDRPFKEKRDIEGGFADSPLRLNEGLGRLERWNEEEITKRADMLAEKALLVWNYPYKRQRG